MDKLEKHWKLIVITLWVLMFGFKVETYGLQIRVDGVFREYSNNWSHVSKDK